jgi:hypothetical protein
VGTTQTISMAQNVYVGIAVSSDTTSSLSTATIDNVTFTPGATPNVTSLSPYTGGVGTAVTIYGTDFGASQGSSTVTFNGLSAASITGWNNTQIVATVPSAIPEGPGPVVVTVNSLASNATVLFTAIDPVITSLAPPAGPPNGIRARFALERHEYNPERSHGRNHRSGNGHREWIHKRWRHVHGD